MTRDNHTFHPLTLDPRSSGKVTRYHTWERVRDQSVGEHTWQVMRILVAVHRHVSRELLLHALFHDSGERVTGDVPFPVKREHPEVKKSFDSMEREALLHMVPWGIVTGIVLSNEEANLFKLAEFIEMMEWGLDELALGNQSAYIVYARCHAQAARMLGEPLPPGVRAEAERYMTRRLHHEHKHRGLGRQ